MSKCKDYRDITFLKPDTMKISLLMAEHQLEPKELAKAAGMSSSILYGIRRGCLAKPKYFGMIAKVLECSVTDIIIS